MFILIIMTLSKGRCKKKALTIHFKPSQETKVVLLDIVFAPNAFGLVFKSRYN